MTELTALLEKYSKPGPRYTSYPTAPYFHTGFGNAEWRAELANSQHPERGLSLYVHIPFCDSLCFYCGCNMVATQRYEKVEPYLQALFREMDAVAALTDPRRKVEQLHLGGGTPTYLKPADIVRLMDGIRARFRIADDAELGCECDPRELTREHLAALRECGFNRVSFGVQDLDHRVQVAINRVQPQPLVETVYRWARELGFASVNMDLIVGLPHQTPTSFARTLDVVTDWAPDRFAVFGYAHVPWMKRHQKLIQERDLPVFSTRLLLGELIHDRLSNAGYVDIGLDHYARPGDEMVQAQRNKTLWRNFQGYTTHRDCDIHAFGASSISQTEWAYAQNEKSLRGYQSGVAADGLAIERGLRLTAEDRLRRDAITHVMCDLELDGTVFGERWGVDCWQHFAAALPGLREQEADGLLRFDNEVLRVSERGRRFLRNIAMNFDAYLDGVGAAGAEAPRYSQTA